MILRVAGTPPAYSPDLALSGWDQGRVEMVICMLPFALACQLFHAFMQLQIMESRNLFWYVASISSYGEWSKQFQQTLSYLGFTNHPSSCCFPSQLCLGHQKFSTSARQQILENCFEKWFHLHFSVFCIPERNKGSQWSPAWHEGREQAAEAEECLNDKKTRTLWVWNKSS